MLEYLIELRRRLLKSLLFIGALFCVLFYFGQPLYTKLAGPLLEYLPAGHSMVAIGVITPLVAPLKLSFYASLLFGMPYLLFQVWAFVSPALYPHERRVTWWAIFPSVALFYLGVAFAYFFVLPMIFNFMISVLPQGVVFQPDMDHYLEFTLHLFVAFGICFQVPLVICLLAVTGLVELDTFRRIRSYVIVAAFFIGMILTPPDVLSQIMLAVPMCLLYELGIVAAALLKKSNKAKSVSA